tara:strand:- start:218 stop:418 length:201 start_codon:yes stop_codon:yes gene_type:complete
MDTPDIELSRYAEYKLYLCQFNERQMKSIFLFNRLAPKKSLIQPEQIQYACKRHSEFFRRIRRSNE